jgi:hypothetical protein
MLDQSTVESALLKWMEEFVEVPHPSLGGWPPCPFARQARLSNNIDIRQGTDPYADCMELLYYEWGKEVVVFWYNHIDADLFVNDVVNDIIRSFCVCAVNTLYKLTPVIAVHRPAINKLIFLFLIIIFLNHI